MKSPKFLYVLTLLLLTSIALHFLFFVIKPWFEEYRHRQEEYQEMIDDLTPLE